MQAGIYWGYANLARGEFSQASYTGKQMAYAEHRPNFTAAAVYRKADGQLRAFSGASERQATTTTYSYLSKDRDVYYEGYGPQREYSLVMPGGNGYGNNQPLTDVKKEGISGLSCRRRACPPWWKASNGCNAE